MKLTSRFKRFGIAALLLTGFGIYAYDYNLIACKLMDRYWNEDKGRCMNPDCRQHDACMLSTGKDKATCETIRPGDSLDKACMYWANLGMRKTGVSFGMINMEVM
ncbi:TPA: toxin [Neisseria subflava]